MNVPLGDTYYFKFTTRAFATGIPTTLAGTPVLSAYEENNLTQITAGITLTVDYDTVTGLNDVAVVATSGNGYEVGKYYDVVITTGTVGGVSVVGEVVGHFRAMAAEGVAGVPDANTTHVADTAQTANDNGADINTLITQIGTAGDGLTDITINAASVDAVWDESLAAHQTALTAGRAASLGGVPIAETTAAGTPTTTTVQLTAGSAIDDYYIDQPLKILSGTGAGQVRIITSYTGATKTCNFDEAFTVAPANGDALAVSIEHVHPVAQIVSEIVADPVIAELTTQGDTNETKLDTIDTVVDAVLALLDDPRAEPGQGAPAVNADLATKVDYLYKWTRNLKDNDGTTTQFYNDAGTVVDHKQTTSSVAGTVTKTEIVSGP